MGEFMTETKQTGTARGTARRPDGRAPAHHGEAAGADPGGRARSCGSDSVPPAVRADGAAEALDGQEAAGILERARASVDPELRRAVESLPGSMRRVARYHFGWEHADGTPAAGNAGKAIRPALVLAAAAALGGRREATAVRAAAAVELVHNFTLLHDDVMDRDTTRRHRPTAWTVFGDADAILAGDALQALALAAARRGPAPGVRRRPPPGSRPASSNCARASTRTPAMERRGPRRGHPRRGARHGRGQDGRAARLRLRPRGAVRGRGRRRTSRRWTRSAGRPGSPSSSSTT